MLLITIDEVSDKQVDQISSIYSNGGVLKGEIDGNVALPLEKVEVLITYGSDVTKENLDMMPSLKWVQVFQSGVEEIPFEELEKRNIRLSNVKGIHGIPMAEYTLSKMLFFSRDIKRFINEQKNHIWNREDLVGEIHGKTVSIFGAGTIGKVIAEKAKAFGMHVIGVNTSGRSSEYFDEMFTLSDKKIVLEKSDFVVLLLPLTKTTYHCIGREELKYMKKDAVLINIGRGGLIDTEALISELENNAIKGAALDVFEEDPLPFNHPLWDLDNVILTPHLAAKTVHYLDRCIQKFEENFSCYVNEQKMIYEVSVVKGY